MGIFSSIKEKLFGKSEEASPVETAAAETVAKPAVTEAAKPVTADVAKPAVVTPTPTTAAATARLHC